MTMTAFRHALFLISVLLYGGFILSVCAIGTACDGEDDVCTGGGQDEPAIFDVFAKWVDDRSAEGQRVLEQILGSSNDIKEGGKSFFDEIKDAFAIGAAEADDEDNIETKLWKGIQGGISKLKDTVDESVEQLLNEQKEKSSAAEDDSDTNAAFDFISFFQTVFSAINSDKSNEEARKLASEFIQKASELSLQSSSSKGNRGFLELTDLILKAFGEVKEAVIRNFGHIDWHRLKPFSAIYFLEYIESLLTPSWKRRAHVFAPEVTVQEVKELHKALYLANLAYLDTVDEIKAGLQEESSEWELIYAQLKNAPGEPAHYIALRKDHSLLSDLVRRDYLDVLLVVRGTKDLSDVLSDGLLDAVEFRGGYGHAGLVKSGEFIAKHHIDLLHSLLNMAKKEKIKLTLIGHSLGAGAAAIAAMILNEDEKAVEANVVGFGCPSLLSKELSESASEYITTIVSDSDMIPRLSGPTLTNAVLDVMSYDWIERGLADLRDALEFLREKMPFEIPKENIDSVYEYVKKLLDDYIKVEIEEMSKIPREDVILIPPGRCAHFYRDGNGVSGQRVSCDFFDSLEISRTMLDDHMIGIGYNRMLLDYMRHRLEDYQFTFEQNIV